MKTFNIYMTGVGGQGIGMLSELLIRAADKAGHRIVGVDTHGLAQRGGIVVSHLRLGSDAHSPLIPPKEADLAIALERHEALRALNGYVKNGGTLVYYDTVWQPLEVRTGAVEEIKNDIISRSCAAREIACHCVQVSDLPDTRMQNIAVLARIARESLIPAITREHYTTAMSDLMEGRMLEKNLHLFDFLMS